MNVPVPTNRLVAFTLIGALLTAGVAGALAAPGLSPLTDQNTDAAAADAPVGDQSGDAAPTPNQDFTPDVQTQSGEEEYEEYEEDEHEEEYEEDEEEYEEDEEEYEEDEEEYEEDKHDDEESHE